MSSTCTDNELQQKKDPYLGYARVTLYGGILTTMSIIRYYGLAWLDMKLEYLYLQQEVYI